MSHVVKEILEEIMRIPRTRISERIGELRFDVPVLHVVKEILKGIMDTSQDIFVALLHVMKEVRDGTKIKEDMSQIVDVPFHA